jgi:hypothetical protein
LLRWVSQDLEIKGNTYRGEVIRVSLVERSYYEQRLIHEKEETMGYTFIRCSRKQLYFAQAIVLHLQKAGIEVKVVTYSRENCLHGKRY